MNGEKQVDVKKADDTDSESDYEDEDVYLMKKEQEFYPVRGHPGMWYKVRYRLVRKINSTVCRK